MKSEKLFSTPLQNATYLTLTDAITNIECRGIANDPSDFEDKNRNDADLLFESVLDEALGNKRLPVKSKDFLSHIKT